VAVDVELHAIRLLEWLSDQTGDTLQHVDVEKFVTANDLPEDSAFLLIRHLVSHGWVGDVHTPTRAMITTDGLVFVQKLRAQRKDPALRARTLHQRMLRWLHQQEDRNSPPIDWSGFFLSEDAYLGGELFITAEVNRAASYLYARNLITATEFDQVESGNMRPRLTAAGQDCVMDFGGNVSDYLNRHHGGNTTHITGNNNIVASNHVTQTITNGMDIKPLLDFVDYIRQVLPTLGLSDEQQAVVDQDAAELREAADATPPDRGRLKRLVDAVMSGVTKAAPSAAASVATALGNEAVKAITGH